MGTILLVIQVIIAVALILFVLLQRSDNDGFGMGSGSGGGVMSGRAKANFMTRTTAILAAAFMFNSLLLAIVTTRSSGDSIVERIEEQQAEQKELTAPLGDEGAAAQEAPKEINAEDMQVPAAE